MMSTSPATRRPVIAAFDFDGTLTKTDSFLPFLRQSFGTARYVWGLFVLSPIFTAYALRLLSNGRAKEKVITYFLGGWTEEILQAKAAAFAATGIPPLLKPEAMARLRWHQEQGHRIIIVSASMEAYLLPWARSVGVSEVVGTRLIVEGGQLTGRMEGLNCYGPEKVKRLRERLGDLGGFEIYAYGDSNGDRELLAAADHPFYRKFE